jgi:hypothetical protein
MTDPFYFPDGKIANNAQDLLNLCEQYPDDATNFLVRQDLEKWLAYIGDYDIAECAANARQIELGDRQKLEDFLNKCHSLTAPQPVPSAATDNFEENSSVPKSIPTTIESSPELIANANVAESQALEAAEVSLAEAIPPKQPEPEQSSVKTAVNSNATHGEEKLSFFQVVAKFIVNILYRNKA